MIFFLLLIFHFQICKKKKKKGGLSGRSQHLAKRQGKLSVCDITEGLFPDFFIFLRLKSGARSTA